MVERRVTLATQGQPQEVGAEVYGRFAVHKPLLPFIGVSTARGDWRVSHIPTGYAVTGNYEPLTKAVARKIAKALDALGPGWDMTDPDAIPIDTKRAAKEILDRFAARSTPAKETTTDG